jgi:hypothetical protein
VVAAVIASSGQLSKQQAGIIVVGSGVALAVAALAAATLVIVVRLYRLAGQTLAIGGDEIDADQLEAPEG